LRHLADDRPQQRGLRDLFDAPGIDPTSRDRPTAQSGATDRAAPR